LYATLAHVRRYGCVRTEPPTPADDSQRRDLLATLGDTVDAAVLAALAEKACTQVQIVAASGVERSGVSRSLARLRRLGLVDSGRGREVTHSLAVESELLELLAVTDRLVVAIIERRAAAQRALAKTSALAARRARERTGTRTGASGRAGRDR
jgi:DNA-binding transcriptional ArsR family regulator